jgi:hypothetical protein
MVANQKSDTKIPFLGRFSASNLNDASIANRLTAWSNAWQGFKQHPILGVGPENFRKVSDLYFDPLVIKGGASENYFDKPHSLLLEILSTSGLLGFLAFLYLLYLAFKNSLLFLSSPAEKAIAYVSIDSAGAFSQAIREKFLAEARFYRMGDVFLVVVPSVTYDRKAGNGGEFTHLQGSNAFMGTGRDFHQIPLRVDTDSTGSRGTLDDYRFGGPIAAKVDDLHIEIDCGPGIGKRVFTRDYRSSQYIADKNARFHPMSTGPRKIEQLYRSGSDTLVAITYPDRYPGYTGRRIVIRQGKRDPKVVEFQSYGRTRGDSGYTVDGAGFYTLDEISDACARAREILQLAQESSLAYLPPELLDDVPCASAVLTGKNDTLHRDELDAALKIISLRPPRNGGHPTPDQVALAVQYLRAHVPIQGVPPAPHLLVDVPAEEYPADLARQLGDGASIIGSNGKAFRGIYDGTPGHWPGTRVDFSRLQKSPCGPEALTTTSGSSGGTALPGGG